MINYKLGDLAKINSNSLSKKDEISEVKYIDTGSLTSNTINNFQVLNASDKRLLNAAKRKVKQNTILYSTVRPNQKHFGILKNLDFSNILVSVFFSTIDVDERIADPDYIYYYITQESMINKMHRLAEQNRTMYPALIPDDIKNMDVSLPNLELQKKIGKFLSNIEHKIKLNNKINDNLFNQINTIYNYWFIQYEFLDNNFKPYKTNSGKLIHNKVLNKKIPENWTVETLANNSISTIIKPGVDKFDNKIYYATADINNKDISLGNKISYDNRESRANMQPIKNSVWFAKMKNTVKHLFVTENMDFMINDSILSTGFCGLDCDEIAFEYISSFILNPYFETIKDVLSHGATQQAVNIDDLNSIKLLIPDKETLLKFHKIVKTIYKQITDNICSNRKLQEIRDFLIPLLMNGQATIE